MNRSLIVAVLTVTMIIMMSTVAFAIAPPHNFYCDNCHGKTSTGDVAGGDGRCVGCHSTMGEASRMPIDSDAMSNYFGAVSGQPAKGSRSTHTWGASAPFNPAAMVQEPSLYSVDLGSSYSPAVDINNTIACIRCHNAKSNQNNTPGVDKPFLRASNTGDSLCLDCHRSRDVASQSSGSHPVNYRAYSTVYKLNTTAFRRTPLSPNQYNPTAMLGNYLVGGKIVCSTCHAPHYADSSSATLGNRSTANGFAQDDVAKGLKGQLQNSKGQLLRTDPIGSSATAINVCSSCHKETKNLNHNAKGQNIQCDHCHAAHVDYNADGSLPNLFLVRRDFSNMSISTGKLAAGKKAIYNTATSLRFKRADGNGICQVCHTPTPGVAIHDNADTRKADCISCHKHSTGFTVAECTSCHGQPPVQGKAAAGYTLDEAFTPHVTHADPAYYNYACKNCHYDGTRLDSHNTALSTGTATYQSVFVETAGSIGEPYRKNIATDYNSSSRRCSGVYCHSNGSPRGAAMAWKSYSTPSWQYGRNKILGKASECSTCHEFDSTLVTNAHSKHVTANSMKCNVCHAATVSSASAIIDRTKHANGTKDVSFITRPANYISVFSAVPFNTTDATCVNSCHTNGLGVSPATPAKWTDASTGACGTCHATAPTSNLHSYHFSNSVGPQLGTTSVVCASCHTYSAGAATHANGVVNLKSASPCQPCHPGATPTFTVGSTVTCESCHTGTASVVSNLLGNYTAPLKPLNSTVGHGKYAIAASCTNCHNASAPHIGAVPTEKRLTASGNAVCTTCHISAVMGVMSTARANLPVHGGTVNTFTTYTSALNRANITATRSDSCAGCHDTHGTTNYMSIRTVINGVAIRPVTLATLSTALRVTSPNGGGVYNGFCQVCHTKNKYFRRDLAPDLTHNNGKNCLSCHTHKAVFAFAPAGGGCNGCHGYPPASNMTGIGILNNYTNAKPETTVGAGGAHTVAGHIPKSAKQSDAWSNCANCHFNQASTHNGGGTPVKSAFVNVVVNPAYKFNNASTIKYNAKTCSNVSCHFKKSPNWTTGL